MNKLTIIFSLFSLFSFGRDYFIASHGHKYAPYGWELNGDFVGIKVDIINEIIQKRMNMRVVHKKYPWKRAQLEVRSGKADILFTAPTRERKLYLKAVNENLLTLNIKAFYWTGHPEFLSLNKFKKISDFKKYKVVEYMGDGWAKENLKDLNITRVNEINDAIRFLAAKRADVFLQGDIVTRYVIKQEQLMNEISEAKSVISSSVHTLLMAKDSPMFKYFSQIDKAAKQIISDGTIKAILSKYK